MASQCNIFSFEAPLLDVAVEVCIGGSNLISREEVAIRIFGEEIVKSSKNGVKVTFVIIEAIRSNDEVRPGTSAEFEQ